MLDDMINFRALRPGLATAGQPTREQFQALRSAGYEVVINLLPPSSASALPGEEELVAQLGMDYVSIPVIWTNPTQTDLEQFFHAMRQYAGRTIFVHCAMNMRVSAFVFLYRVLVEGISKEAALPDLRSVWEPDGVWQAFIERALAQDGNTRE